MRKCKLLLALLAVLCAPLLARANDSAKGWCEIGGQQVVTSGLNSTTKVQASYPQCTVTVYNHGAGTLATIFQDNNVAPTPLSNPFFAGTEPGQSSGQWIFYAANGRYDVTMTGAGLPGPVTYFDIILCDPFATGVCGGSGPITLPQTFITLNNETATLANSLKINAGNNITFDTTIANQLTINSTTGNSVCAGNWPPNEFCASPPIFGAPNIGNVGQAACSGCNPLPVTLNVLPNTAVAIIVNGIDRITPFSVVSTLGTVLTKAFPGNGDNVWYSCNATGGLDTFTITSTAGLGSAADFRATALNITGVAASNCLDLNSGQWTTVTGPNYPFTSALSVAQPTEIVIAAYQAIFSAPPPIWTAGAGYLSVSNVPSFISLGSFFQENMVEVLQTTTGLVGTQTSTASLVNASGGSLATSAALISFKLVTTGTGPLVPRIFTGNDLLGDQQQICSGFTITGWGAGAVAGNCSGNNIRSQLTITAGTGPSASPTILERFPGAWQSAPACNWIQVGGTGTIQLMSTSTPATTSQVTGTWLATPTNGLTYQIQRTCL